MFYTTIEEYIETMSAEEYMDIMLDAFADEMSAERFIGPMAYEEI